MTDAPQSTARIDPTRSPPAAIVRETCTRGVRSLLSAAWDFVFPRSCEYCRKSIDASPQPAFAAVLCSDCRGMLAPQIANSCDRCAAPLGPFLDRKGCPHCRKARFAFERSAALGEYDSHLRTACLRIKHPGGAPLAASLALLLCERHEEFLSNAGFERVVPVPHHWTQRLGRESHASETLARVLARRLQVDFCGHILKKTRRTPAQASLPLAKRQTNLRGAFAVSQTADVAGRAVLLVDDVLTTGTTANEAARTLLRAGARSVSVAVVARGLGRGRGF